MTRYAARHRLPARPEPLKVGERVVDLQIFQATGRKIIGTIRSLAEIECNGRKVASAVVVGGSSPQTAWVVCDDVQRWRRALDSEVSS